MNQRKKLNKFLTILDIFLIALLVLPILQISNVHATGLALDGSVNASRFGTTITLALTTSINNDVIIVQVGSKDSSGYVTVSSISSNPSLTFLKRTSKTYYYQTNGYLNSEEWYAVWTSHGAITITVTMTGTMSSYGKGTAFGINGANISNPPTSVFDPNAGANPTASGYSANPTVPITTSNANDFIIGLEADYYGVVATVGAGYTKIQLVAYLASEYKIVSATQSETAVNFMLAQWYWIMIADAVMQASAGGYALNLRVMDWDLIDSISGAIVYKDADTLTSNGNGWANWTGVSGTVAVKVKYYGFWVNGTFSVTMDADKTINVKCKLYDVTITAKPNNEIGIISGANVTAYNNTGNSNGKIKSGITVDTTGQVTLTNVPNATLRFIMYAKSDYSIIIANTTQLITSDDYSFNIIANQNYVTVTLSFGYEAIIWMNALSILHLLSIISIVLHKKLKKRTGGEKACMQEKHV